MRSAAKAIIFNVYKYFERQASKNKYRGPSHVTRKTAEATGYSEQTVRRIVGKKALLCGGAFTSPAKRYKVERRTVCLDDFDVEVIRRLVHDFYREKKYPTLDSLLPAVKEKVLFGGERAVPPCGEFCIRWALSTRRLTIRGTFMSNPASSTRGRHTCDV